MSRHINAIFLLFALLSCNDSDDAFELSSLNGDYKGPCVVSTIYSSGEILVDTLDVTMTAVAHETKDSIMYLTIEEFDYHDLIIGFGEGPISRNFGIYEAGSSYDPTGRGSFPSDSLLLNVSFERLHSSRTRRIVCACKKILN